MKRAASSQDMNELSPKMLIVEEDSNNSVSESEKSVSSDVTQDPQVVKAEQWKYIGCGIHTGRSK